MKTKKFISQEYSEQKGGKNLKDDTKTARKARHFTTVFFAFAILVTVGLVSFTIVFFFSSVNGTSMMNTLNANWRTETGEWITDTEAWKNDKYDTDSVLVNRYKKPKRGDVIVVEHYRPSDGGMEYHIKRLIALGGESICFILIGDRYRIEVDGVSYDEHFGLDQYLGRNMRCNEYDEFYKWQQNPNLRPYSPHTFFGWTYKDEQGEEQSFVQYVASRNRNEIVLPKNYIFYMGDNRGGCGSGTDNAKMSRDCTYYGPKPASRIVGVVEEIIKNKSAPQWVFNKLGYFFTFRWHKL